MIRRFIICSFLWLPLALTAQHQLGLHFLPQTYQSTMTNPAFQQDAKFQLTLPIGAAFGAEIYHSGFVLNDLFVDPDATPLTIDPNQAIDAMRPRNFLETTTMLMPLAFSVRVRDKWQVGFHIAQQNLIQFTYADDFPGLLWRGNGAYIDQDVDLGLGLDITSYLETGLSVSTDITDKIRVGGRLKFLGGLFNISTDPGASQVSLYTDPEFYQITLTTDYRLRAATSFPCRFG